MRRQTPEEITRRPAVRQLVRDLVTTAPPSIQAKARNFASVFGAPQ